MPIALAALVIFAVLVWLGRRSRYGKADWRVGSALLAVGALAGAALSGVRGEWPISLLFLAAFAWSMFDIRRRGAPAPAQPAPKMSDTEARSVLGVGSDATRDEIQAAYLRLMRAVHPDAGGTSGLAAQLNAARERLLGKK
jgi:hypothetical protein